MELDGVRYIHRLPCVEEKKQIIRQHLKFANTVRVVVTLHEITIYFWNKIPFKEEAKLLFRIIRRTYEGVRGILYYWFRYRKKK